MLYCFHTLFYNFYFTAAGQKREINVIVIVITAV